MSKQISRALARSVSEFYRECDAQGREPTAAERMELEAILERAESEAKGVVPRLPSLGMTVDEVGRQIGPANGAFSANGGGRGIGWGDAFTGSPQFKAFTSAPSRPQQYSLGPVEVSPSPQFKAGTLFAGEQGAGLIPSPQVIPGQVQQLFQPLGVADLFASGIATTNAVRYCVEGTATNAAAGVIEGGTKPASDLALSTLDEPVRKIATTVAASDELLDDVSALTNYVNNRLVLFCRVEEDRQVLRGAGGAELVGLFNRGIGTVGRVATDDNATFLAKVLASTYGSSLLMPDAILLHPTNWLNTRLLRDGAGGTVGQFYGGGPFTGAYGAGAANVSLGLFGGVLWGVPVFLTTVVGVGTALVGSFKQGAQLWARGGVSVEMTNAHLDYFVRDMVMFRAESRRALTVYRPASFTCATALA